MVASRCLRRWFRDIRRQSTSLQAAVNSHELTMHRRLPDSWETQLFISFSMIAGASNPTVFSYVSDVLAGLCNPAVRLHHEKPSIDLC
jgi:hypothetical protein